MQLIRFSNWLYNCLGGVSNLPSATSESNFWVCAIQDTKADPCALSFGVFHSHGGSPIAGGFLSGKFLLERMIWGYPLFMTPPFRVLRHPFEG